MGRYSGNLHKLIDAANVSNNSRSKWAQVLHYLEGHTVGHSQHKNPPHDSPLPPYTAPSVELEEELTEAQGPKRDETPLRIAVKAGPAQIIGALCHLCPEAARLEDSRSRLPLHWACRRSSTDDPETNKVLKILILAYPEGLLHRDDGGRTPLHWLFWYHAPSRPSRLVELFSHKFQPSQLAEISQPFLGIDERWPLPPIPPPGGDVPPTALIIPDARHGALPLHYAVMQGASKDVIRTLLNAYPSSKAAADRKGRTPLAWYLGAGHLMDSRKHVCGETNDPNAPPWWETKLSTAIIQLLISSRVARKQDDTGRMPLHWACHLMARSQHGKSHGCLALKAIQLLLDNYADALTTKDREGRTPLQLFFDVVADLQAEDYQRDLANQTLRDNVNLIAGGPVAWNPPMQLLELLLKSPESDGQEVTFRTDHDRPTSAALIEDTRGGLPLHAALRVASSPAVIKALIQANPTSLVDTTEEPLQTPLICALKSPYSAPLQSFQTIELLMQAYVTSRHGTFMDGRLALKMEDASGKYPLHYAAENQAALDVVNILCEKFPRAAMFRNADGDLPIHCLLSQKNLFEPTETGMARGASLAQSVAFLSRKEVAWKKEVEKVQRSIIATLAEPLLESAEHLQIASSAHGMTPLHIVVAFDAVPYETIYRMLETYPEAASMITTAEGYNFSCLDLHELRKKDTADIEHWSAIRELLFAFCPTLDAWRSKEDVLEACVKLIRQEAEMKTSYHLDNLEDVQEKKSGALAIAETLSSIMPPEVDAGYRPKHKTNPLSPSRAAASPSALPVSPNAKRSPRHKVPKLSKPPRKAVVNTSIYDGDGFGGGYEVSPDNSDESDVDDDSYSSVDDSEYDSQEENELDTYGDTVGNNSTMESASVFGNDKHLHSKDTIDSFRPSASPERNAFDSPKHKFVEEKKEDSSPDKTMQFSPRNPKGERLLSEIAMRMWCFFVLYNNKKNPEDNYLRQVEAVLNDIDFELVESLLSLPIPDFARTYLEPGTSTEGVTLRDLASPRPKALFHSFTHFLGKYEFPTEKDGLLLHRSTDASCIYVRAVEHVVATESFKEGEKLAPGAAEEAIWSHGEVQDDEEDYMESRFELDRRPIYFKFMKHPDAFENEVRCRSELGLDGGQDGNYVVPLQQKYDFFGGTNADKRYKRDASDQRFKRLRFFGGESIDLTDYPYALVFPYSAEGDLFDYFYHHGVSAAHEISHIGNQIGRTLKLIHSKGVIHGNVSTRTIFMSPRPEDYERSWAISDFSNACLLTEVPVFSGSVSKDGSAQFSTSILPPEMFVKLTPGEARMYNSYWNYVEETYGIKVDQAVVEPRVDLATGNTYVVRCHYVPADGDTKKLPDLPYKLLPVRESVDIWCFGQLLFTLCSGGKQLFPTNLKTSQLLDFVGISNWDELEAASMINEHVEDPLAQDLLLLLLAGYEYRSTLKMENVLNHPFLKRDINGPDTSVQRIIDNRIQETIKHQRWRRGVITERSESDWLKQRTVNVNCWNFKTLCKIHFSATEMVKSHLGRQTEAQAMPCGFVILPYKLSAKNKKGRLAPTTKKDVERSEKMGTLLLSLARACTMAAKINDTLSFGGTEHWTAKDLIGKLILPGDEFDDLCAEVEKIASAHVEVFRADPSMAANKLVERRVREIVRFFRDAKSAFLYFVDEHSGVPLADSKYEPYPLSIPEGAIENIVLKGLPFVHICTLYACGSSGGISGLVKLIFEAAFPHIPPSWSAAAKGLAHRLNDAHTPKEVKILQDVIATMTGAKVADPCGDLLFIRDFVLKQDVSRRFCDMTRISCAGVSFWTGKENADDIVEAAENYTFREALDIQRTLEAKLEKQDQTIKKLKEEIERLSFRKEMNLSVPDDQETDDILEANAVE